MPTTPTAFISTLTALGYTQAAFARHIGYRPNQVSRWARGASPIPVIVAEYLALRLKVDDLNRALQKLRIQASSPES